MTGVLGSPELSEMGITAADLLKPFVFFVTKFAGDSYR
jgi:hypothetical protein